MSWELTMSDHVRIRQSNEGDADFVAGLVRALLEFGSPMWEPDDSRVSGFRDVLTHAVQHQDARSTVLIAEADAETRLGFISLRVREDPASGERAHVADVAVRDDARRRGVGAALMGAGEKWARDRGLSVVSLDVWSTNERALRFYRRMGYQPESIHLSKALK
jgi:ribosomal protein S18 acetylase RimI-like enzyme